MGTPCVCNDRNSSRGSRVHFPDDEHLTKIVEFDDDKESEDHRVCYWEIFARDRARFKDRIEQVAEILKPILESDHRKKMFDETQGIKSKEFLQHQNNSSTCSSGTILQTSNRQQQTVVQSGEIANTQEN